jgi:hypothetical protein
VFSKIEGHKGKAEDRKMESSKGEKNGIKKEKGRGALSKKRGGNNN